MGLSWINWLRKRKRRRKSRSGSPSPSRSSSSPVPKRLKSSGSRFAAKGKACFFLRIETGRRNRSETQRAFALEIEWEKYLESFNQIDCSLYILHDQSCSDPLRFRKLDLDDSPNSYRYLGPVKSWSYTGAVVVGSYVYVISINMKKSKGLIRRLHIGNNNDHPVPRCEILTRQRKSKRSYSPQLISLRGRLYCIERFPNGWSSCSSRPEIEPFGEVYDPVSDQWFDMKPPCDLTELKDTSTLFVASLGDSVGKILVYIPRWEDLDPVVYFYDVVTGDWDVVSIPLMTLDYIHFRHISRSAVISEDDQFLYWFDRDTTFIYAFDWKLMQLYTGPIIGMENNLVPLDDVINSSVAFTLHHLSGDLFCLCWSSAPSDRGMSESDETCQFHITMLRILKDPALSCLRAMAVGCLDHTVPGYHCLIDSVLFRLVTSSFRSE